MIYDNFTNLRTISKDNCTILVGDDGTCIKVVDLPKCFSRLHNEFKCLEILDGHIAPKLIEYDKENHLLRMEYINGLTISEYVRKYGEIPKYYFAKLVSNLINLLDYKIEYGTDFKFNEHFIIVEENQNVRIIDFGISNIFDSDEDMKSYKDKYKKQFAFVFKDSNKQDIEESKDYIVGKLRDCLIEDLIIEKFFNEDNFDKL